MTPLTSPSGRQPIRQPTRRLLTTQPTSPSFFQRVASDVESGPIEPAALRLSTRWLAARGYALRLARVKAALATSTALVSDGSSSRSKYLHKLKCGVRVNFGLAGALAQIRGRHSAQAATNQLIAGHVKAEVASEADLQELELWEQGDAKMYEAEQVA